jgi:expansin (peptidoglycan-binding protein)
MFSKYLYFLFYLINLTSANNITNLTYLYQNWQTGEGTYYGFHSQGGACGLDPVPLTENETFASVAMNAPTYYGSHICGMCLEVIANGKGSGQTPFPKKPMKVIVKDLCPECKKGDLDFAINGDGRWNIKWRAISCSIKQGIQFMFEGSNPWYIKLQIRNTPIPIIKVEIWNGKLWHNMIKEMWGFWIAINGPYNPPIKIRITSLLNEVKITNITSITANKVIQNTTTYFTKIGIKN